MLENLCKVAFSKNKKKPTKKYFTGFFIVLYAKAKRLLLTARVKSAARDPVPPVFLRFIMQAKSIIPCGRKFAIAFAAARVCRRRYSGFE